MEGHLKLLLQSLSAKPNSFSSQCVLQITAVHTESYVYGGYGAFTGISLVQGEGHAFHFFPGELSYSCNWGLKTPWENPGFY